MITLTAAYSQEAESNETSEELVHKDFQVSFVPGLGTNGIENHKTSVDYSFNIIGGLTGEVQVAEVGGVFNAVIGDVEYVQVAGAVNYVGGNMSGVQISGSVNTILGDLEGLQGAGAVNYVHGDVKGLQISGAINASRGKVVGQQIGGLVNYAPQDSRLIQLGGAVNYLGSNSLGLQVSGLVNVAGNDFRGNQISGGLNVARNIKGNQLGFINVNDTISGIPIGFFTYSRKGLHQIELSSNEITHANLAFKTGTTKFYNTFIGGLRFREGENPVLAYGYGIGTSVKAGNKGRVFFDLQAVNHQIDNDFGANIINSLTISYEWRFAKKMALAAGPSFKVFVYDPDLISNDSASYFDSMVPYTVYDGQTNYGRNVSSWVGGHVALRLF